MKKTIKGVKYNTDTAVLLESAGNYETVPHGNPGWMREDLYMTKKCEFFIHGQGGEWTKYAEYQDDGSYTAGEKIVPITERGAKRWMQNKKASGTLSQSQE